jgi:hypothetical protein
MGTLRRAKWNREQDVYLVPYVQRVCAKQIEALRPAVQRADPKVQCACIVPDGRGLTEACMHSDTAVLCTQGLFRTDWLEALLQLPPVGQ